MINIFETELSQKKSVKFALKQIYGLNLVTSALVCKKLGISTNLKIADVSDEQVFKLVSLIESMDLNLSSDLKKLNAINFKKIVSIKLLRGLRKISGLPVRGQRTHSNSKTAKLLNKKFKFLYHMLINKVINFLLNQNYSCENTSHNLNNKIKSVRLFKEHYHYLKTTHSYHLVDPSPWPLVASLGAVMLTTGLVLYMHKFSGGWNLLITGLLTIWFVMFTWWRDIVREATFEDQHTKTVQKGLRLGMLLFIVSEVMFFFAFFWAFFHSSIAPAHNIGSVWPPKAIVTINTYTIPLTNTFFLLTSGATVTWSHHALLSRAKKHTVVALILTLALATLFTLMQVFEYINAPFNISDGVYGSCFYMATGFHGFHVVIGTIALFVSLIRITLNHFTDKHHFGFESAIWYWHFVDVVWLFLFINVYWWSAQ